MSFPTALFIDTIADAVGSVVEIKSIHSVSGGSINDSFHVVSNKGSFFVKSNQSKKFPEMFVREADGLRQLEKQCPGFTPQVVGLSDDGIQQILILDWIENIIPNEKSWLALGSKLAVTHQLTASQFGLLQNNFMGSVPQINTPTNNFTEFFINCRLQPLVEATINQGLMPSEFSLKFDELFRQFNTLIPEELPSLIHGDLWSGNVIFNKAGTPKILDPAIAYSHREADIAMTTLFGGFHESFYEAYNAIFPLEPNWKKRTSLFNLYPLLIHLKLFGHSYLGDIRCILEKYT